MSGISNKSGFTLIEILIAVALMALLATFVIPNLGGRSPRVERDKFVASLNALMRFAWQDAIVTNKLHKIDIDFAKRLVTVETETGRDEKGQPSWQPIKRAYTKTRVEWPKNVEVKNFYIDGRDAQEDYRMAATTGVFFYLVPDGLAQEIIINAVDTKDKLPSGKVRPFSLVLNPFSAQFTYYDTFKK